MAHAAQRGQQLERPHSGPAAPDDRLRGAGRDAVELRARVEAAMAAAVGLFVVDCTLEGVGVGPRWMAQLTFTDTGYPGAAPTAITVASCVQGGDPPELNQRVQAVLSTPLRSYVALEAAGAGAGRDYM